MSLTHRLSAVYIKLSTTVAVSMMSYIKKHDVMTDMHYCSKLFQN